MILAFKPFTAGDRHPTQRSRNKRRKWRPLYLGIWGVALAPAAASRCRDNEANPVSCPISHSPCLSFSSFLKETNTRGLPKAPGTCLLRRAALLQNDPLFSTYSFQGDHWLWWLGRGTSPSPSEWDQYNGVFWVTCPCLWVRKTSFPRLRRTAPTRTP